MSLVLVVGLCALVLGWLLGGGLERLGEVPLADRWLVVAAFAVQAAGSVAGGGAYALGLALSALLALAFLARNRGVRGTGLIATGLVCNAVVVGLNGAMPVSVHAMSTAGADLSDIAAGADPRHEVAGPSTRLSWLGDVIPVRLPVRPEVVSPGDVLLAAGIGQLIVIGMGGGFGRSLTGRGSPPPAPSRRRGRHGSRHLR